jgi:hypothetical protein
MPTLFSGGCACGAIRYECTAGPLLVWKYHCRNCQRSTGSAFTTVVFFPASAFTFTKGKPIYYVVKGESRRTAHRGFCPACGSPVGGRAEAFPDIRAVHAASLDDPSGLEPLAEIWTSSAQPWDYLNPALPKYEHQPTEAQMQELMAARS